MSHQFNLSVIVLLFSVLISSCSGLIVSPVSNADRDTQRTYDGNWNLIAKPLSSIQNVGITRFECTFEEQTIPLNVTDGIGRIYYSGKDYAGNIASDGKFRIEIPTDYGFSKSDGNNDIKNRITYIFQGFLSEQGASGLFIMGKEDLNNAGCSTKLTIMKV